MSSRPTGQQQRKPVGNNVLPQLSEVVPGTDLGWWLVNWAVVESCVFAVQHVASLVFVAGMYDYK